MVPRGDLTRGPQDHFSVQLSVLRVSQGSGYGGAAWVHHVIVEILGEQLEEVAPGVATEDPVVPVGVP